MTAPAEPRTEAEWSRRAIITTSRTKRSVPALQPAHGTLAVGNAIGIELAAFNRSVMTVDDFANPALHSQVHVAEIPALILAKGAKVGERLTQPRKGEIRDKDLGDLWRLMACGDPAAATGIIVEHADHPQIGGDVRHAADWTQAVLADPVSVERAKRSLEGFVDPAHIEDSFARWRDALPT